VAALPAGALAPGLAVDAQGLPFCVSPRLPAPAVAALGRLVSAYVEQVLSYGREWRVIALARALDPTSPLIAVLAADYALACEDVPGAVSLVKAATRLKAVGGARLSSRERLYVQAFKTYAGKQREKNWQYIHIFE